MKRIFVIALLSLITHYSYSQSNILPLKDSSIYYDEIVKVSDTVNADKLYSLAQTWFAKAFKNTKLVLQVNDRQSLKLIGKGITFLKKGIGDNLDIYIYYTIAVDIKQGRYRYRFYDFGFESGGQTEDASKGYSHYLHGEIHRMLFESNKQALKRYEFDYFDYLAINKTALKLIADLKISMSNINADNF